MALNLFGPPTKDDIKVAYIDPILGLVEGVSICEANEYAKKEPGTTFIFRNGNQTLQYLNVNEINQLDPNVLTTTDECGGISQKKECGPPSIQIFGGGGIGAAGNPIVGNDGAILAVDIIRGGNGYQYPPLVSARDICNYGSGATFTTVIGEVVETTETFDNEADFEDYELCEPTDIGYGRRYGPDGEDLGPWDPKVYTDPGQDPIRNEVVQFQEIVRRLARAPFWTTRKNKPTKITCSDPRVIPSKYDVTFSSWNEFMNSYAISPVSPSNVRGSDFAGRVFTFEWTEDFPTDGEYIFRGLCDNTAQLYVDDLKIADLAGFNAPVRPIQKTFQKGLHNIRVDLLNIPFTETVTKPSITPPLEPSSAICISVIDESSPSAKSQQADWDLFRKNYPQRKFYLLDPGGRSGFKKKIPAGFNSNNNAFGPIAVNRDDGNTSRISDWFSICGLKSVPTGTVVSLAIDNSGSMREKTVRASYASFKEKCRAAGIVLVDTTFGSERFIGPHNKPLPSGPTLAPPVGALPPTTETIISPRSWNENPMGVSVTIDAPEPPIPQEPVPEQEGRCPNNPIWTTRFPGAREFWYPVQFNGSKSPQGAKEPWAKFFNRYAISPVPPLDTPGSDGGGVVFTNSWDLEIPYDGFYQFAVQRDNTARLYVDGNLAFDTTTSGDDRWVDFRNKPKFQKIFITKGRHTIGVELENRKTEAFDQVSQKIFRTKDWQVSATQVAKIVDVDFNVKSVKSSTFASAFKISELGINVSKPARTLINQTIPTKVSVGKVYVVEIEVPQSKGITLRVTGNTLEVEDLRASTARDLFVTISRGKFFDVKNGAKKATCKFVVDETGTSPNLEGLSGGTSKDGVTYEGPPLFAYKDNRWGEFMNNHSVSPIIPGNLASERMRSTWRGVRFPESGQYDITFLSDSGGILFIGGKEVLRAQQFAENPQTFKVNITQGTYDVVVDNDYPYFSQGPNTIEYFRDINPTGFALVIRKNVSVLREGSGKSWDENPMGIGAILIPPPCPRRIRGRGVVTDVIVNDPGNGYLPPVLPTTTPPSTLALIQTNVPGVPGSGAGAGAGGGAGAPSVPGGLLGGLPGVPAVPLSIPSPPSGPPTGINARFIPQFEVVRDPVVVDPQKLLQVTDLVGLKQTGYVNGRAYYGAVYYDNGIRYAGFYETVGEPIRVYDTLRESILAQVTTPPSAILRQGTDIRSNNPLLNIPGTVQSTLNSNSIVGAGDISAPSVPFIQEPLQDPIYPVSLRLKRVLVEDPGINYNVTDQIRIIPSNGAVLEPVFGSFGRIIKVAVIDPGFGFTEYPRIEMFTPL
jgi:hypothetical protein